MRRQDDAKRFERFRQRMLDYQKVLEYTELVIDHGPPLTLAKKEPSLIELWRRGELELGPHIAGHGGRTTLVRLTCYGCGCCRQMKGHLYCEQCLVGRRPWAQGNGRWR